MSRIVRDYLGMVLIAGLLLAGFGAAAIFLDRDTTPEPVEGIAVTSAIADSPDLLVDPAWLSANADSIDLIIDLSDRDRYELEHIPGAVHIWYKDAIPISAANYGEGGSLSDPASGSLTLDYPAESHIVVYDNNESERASRFLWLLRTSGFESSWVLDGGLAGWKGAGLPVSTESASLEHGQDSVATWHAENEIVTDELLQRLEEPGLVVIDSRTPGQQKDTVNETIRTGKIPGSWSIPTTDVMRSDGTFRSQDELQELFAPLGIDASSEVVVYGRFGTETGQMWLALRLAGFDNVRVYDDGWIGWGWNTALPIEPLGTQPTPAPPAASPAASPVASPAASPVATPAATP
jgi:thiosulfate/3-mercaptopyruvate sulfurtransferase